MITLINGHVQTPAGLIVPNGSIALQLNVDGTVIAAPGGIVMANEVVVFQFDASGNIQAGAQIYSNKELQPQNSLGLGTYYLVTFYDPNGARLNKNPMWWQFPEAANATVDISTMTPYAVIGGNVIFYPIPAGAGGIVTSVAFVGDGTVLSSTPSAPVTGAGNVVATLLPQSANVVLAGPTSGGAANPTFRALVLADIPGGIGISGSAGQSAYFSATNAITGGTVELDMAGFAGADLGAKMNNCMAALPAAGGKCKGDNLAGALTLSTSVTTTKAVVFTFCGQQVTQTANVNLNAANSGIVGCAGTASIFTKGANIDQITLSASRAALKGMQLVGVKASFTGNGVVTATGALQALIEDNTISGQANDAIKDNSGTFSVNQIRGNVLSSWGVHGYESTSTSQQSLFVGNYLQGDGTATGAGILNGGSSAIISNFLKWTDNSQFLFDDTTSAQSHPVIGNRITNGGTAGAFKATANSIVTGNVITQSGGTNPTVVLGIGSQFMNNFVNATNADAIQITAGNCIISGNQIGVGISIAGNHYGMNFTGDQIGTRTFGNQITMSDTANVGNVDACIHNNPSGGHNLSMLFEGDNCTGLNSGSVTMYGFFLDNSNNLNTNWSQTVRDMACVHITTCIKRTDTQNNVSAYIDIQPGDAGLDAGTGSNQDIFAFDNFTLTFATLVTPIGNGARVYCRDCTQAKPTGSGGGGAFVVREAGQWNGL